MNTQTDNEACRQKYAMSLEEWQLLLAREIASGKVSVLFTDSEDLDPPSDVSYPHTTRSYHGKEETKPNATDDYQPI